MHISHAFLVLFSKFLESVVTKYYKAIFHAVFLYSSIHVHLTCWLNSCGLSGTGVVAHTRTLEFLLYPIIIGFFFFCLKSRVSRGQTRPETKGP